MTPRSSKRIEAASDYAKIVQMTATGIGAVLTGAALLTERQARKKEQAAKAEKQATQDDKKQVVDMPQQKAHEA